MNCIVFGKIANHYLQITDELGKEINTKEKQVFVSQTWVDGLSNGRIYPREKIKNTLISEIDLKSKNYLFSIFDEHFVLIPVSYKWAQNLLTKNKLIRHAGHFSKLIHKNFSLLKRKELLNNLFGKKTDISACLSAFCEYIFCDDYSFWLYNPITETFTCSSTSLRNALNYIPKSVESFLNDVIDDGYGYEYRAVDKSRSAFEIGSDLATVHRFKIKLDMDETFGVLSLYSSRNNLSLSIEMQEQIKNVVQLKIVEYIHMLKGRFDKVIDYFSRKVKSDNVHEFSHGLVRLICHSLNFEACSLFIADDANNNLVLVATNDLLHDGVPSENVIYKINKKCPTTDVFNIKVLRRSL